MSVLSGPLDTPPDIAHEVARSALDDVLDDLEMGRWDAEVRSWVELADPGYIAAIASWCHRSQMAGRFAAQMEE